MAIKPTLQPTTKKTKKVIKPRIPVGGQQQAPQMGMAPQGPTAPGAPGQQQLPGYNKGKAGKMKKKC